MGQVLRLLIRFAAMSDDNYHLPAAVCFQVFAEIEVSSEPPVSEG